MAFTSALRPPLSVLLLRLQHVADQVGHRGVLLASQQVLGLDQALHQAGVETHLHHGLHHGREHGGGRRQAPDHRWRQRGGRAVRRGRTRSLLIPSSGAIIRRGQTLRRWWVWFLRSIEELPSGDCWENVHCQQFTPPHHNYSKTLAQVIWRTVIYFKRVTLTRGRRVCFGSKVSTLQMAPARDTTSPSTSQEDQLLQVKYNLIN